MGLKIQIQHLEYLVNVTVIEHSQGVLISEGSFTGSYDSGL